MNEIKTKILFCHFDYGGGGAEKVLVNLANALDKNKYDVTIGTVFDYGVNRQFLNPDIKTCSLLKRKPFNGISYILRCFSPTFLRKRLTREEFDVEIAFLEGIPTRIVSGSSNTRSKKFAWIHNLSEKAFSFHMFRSIDEAKRCFNSFDRLVFVSEYGKEHFPGTMPFGLPEGTVVNNTIEVERIIETSSEDIPVNLDSDVVNMVNVGRLCGQKSHDRLFRALAAVESKGIRSWHLYILGAGPELGMLQGVLAQLGLTDKVTFLGYDENPYRYVAKMDLYVCSSLAEGYSTSVTESIIVGTPVLTTLCSGMSEILGDDGAGLIVDNSIDGLTQGLLKILPDAKLLAEMKEKAHARSCFFSSERTVKQFEDLINS